MGHVKPKLERVPEHYKGMGAVGSRPSLRLSERRTFLISLFDLLMSVSLNLSEGKIQRQNPLRHLRAFYGVSIICVCVTYNDTYNAWYSTW